MLARFLLINFEYVTPEMRLLIAGLLIDFYREGEFSAPVKQIQKRYGVTLHTVNKTLRYLVQSGYVDRTNLPHRRGRPVGRYVFTSVMKRKVETVPKWVESLSTSTFWKQVIRQLVVSNDEVVQDEKYSVSNRYLVCMLALFSNETGVVTKLPAAQLRKITGFTALRLRSQLATLKEKKVLINYTGGVTGKYLFGKAEGIYFLNTEQVARLLNVPKLVTPFRTRKFVAVTPERGMYVVKRLVRTALLVQEESKEGKRRLAVEEAEQKKFWDYDREEFSQIAPLFSDRSDTRVSDYLQTKLDIYVARGFTINSKYSKEEVPRALSQELKEDIITDCMPSKWSEAGKLNFVEDPYFNKALFSVFADMIIRIVQGICNTYTALYGLELRSDRVYRIVPFETGSAIEVYEWP